MARNSISRKSILAVFKQYICGKNQKDYVKHKTFKVGVLKENIFMTIPSLSNRNVYISTLSLMHIYERRGAVLENAIVPYFNALISFPDGVYVNKAGKNKRGQILFAKKIERHYLVAVLEIVSIQRRTVCQVVTILVCDYNYLRNLKCLWNGRTATPSS